MKSNHALVRLACSTLLALALVLLAVTGCSASSEVQARAVGKATTPEVPALGPYPLNVKVQVGEVALTLTSVRVMDKGTPAGGGMRFLATSTPEPAPAGSRFVYVTLRVDDATSSHFKGPDLFRSPVVVADGKTIGVGARSTDAQGTDFSVYGEHMEFAVPDVASSAVLRLPLTSTDEVVSFRLW